MNDMNVRYESKLIWKARFAPLRGAAFCVDTCQDCAIGVVLRGSGVDQGAHYQYGRGLLERTGERVE